MTQARGFFKTLCGVWEDTYGTTPSISSGEMFKLPFNTAEIGSEEDMIEPATIRGNRYQAEPAFGNINVNGRVTVPIDVRNIGYWLRMLLGDPSTTGSGTYTHIFDPATTLPSSTLEVGFSDISSYHKFSGVKVNGMSMSFQKSTELTADVDILGKAEVVASGAADPGPTSKTFDRFNAKGISLKKGGSTITTIRKLDLSIRNELATDIFCIDGTGFRNSLPETNFVVEGSFEVLFENQDIYNEAINGTETSLQVTLTNGTNSLVFDIYELKFPRRAVTSSGSAPVFLDVPFKAYYQDNAQSVPLRVTLTNDVSAYN
jgi:hypothetical protein